MQCNADWPHRMTDAFWISEMRLKTETKWTNGIALIDYRLRCWSVDSVYEINNSSTRITGNKYNLAWTKQNLFATKKNSVWVSASLERSEEKEAGHLLPQTNDGNFIYPMAVGSSPGRSIIYQLFTSWPTPTLFGGPFWKEFLSTCKFIHNVPYFLASIQLASKNVLIMNTMGIETNYRCCLPSG